MEPGTKNRLLDVLEVVTNPLSVVAFWPFASAVVLLGAAIAWRSWGLVACAAVVFVLGAAFRWMEKAARPQGADRRGGGGPGKGSQAEDR